MLDTQTILNRASKVLIGNYARQSIVMSRGEGSLIWDAAGKPYIDLFAGFGGAILGHCHSELIAAAGRQAHLLWHVGNTFHTLGQVELAEKLAECAFAGQAFFCHSGLEADEAACKLARLRGSQSSPKRWKIISFNKSFHGRSLAMISATGNPAVKAGFEPMVQGFVQVEPGDITALARAVDDQTAAILMEPIQGEGGVNLYPPEFAAQVRSLCDEKGLTLIFDEVWTGCGRTGRWFGYQHFTTADGKPVEPDILTLGKAIGGGLPVGVMWAKPAIAQLLVPGKHGCTLGGNPVCMAVSRTILDIIQRDGLLGRAADLGERGAAKLRNDPRIKSKVAQVRGRGLMLGIELNEPPKKIVETGLEKGVVLNLTASKVIRLAPALNIPEDLWEKGLDLVIEAVAAAA